MMSKGFITTVTLRKNQTAEDVFDTEIQIRDLYISSNDEDSAIAIFIAETGAELSFRLPEARTLVEALQEIINRYDTPKIKNN